MPSCLQVYTSHHFNNPFPLGFPCCRKNLSFTLWKLKKNRLRQTPAALFYQVPQKILLYKPAGCYALVLKTSSRFLPKIHTAKVKAGPQLSRALAASCLPPCVAAPLFSSFSTPATPGFLLCSPILLGKIIILATHFKLLCWEAEV